ncbi:hypothetical protein [Flectobacillus major]|uniref:hypothetical protein n=1 Tax=Flectobacillus major TaxID=103 RepID=UPI000408DCA8|nr:hypothetical protein [Flectobacillus major]
MNNENKKVLETSVLLSESELSELVDSLEKSIKSVDRLIIHLKDRNNPLSLINKITDDAICKDMLIKKNRIEEIRVKMLLAKIDIEKQKISQN